MSAPRPPATQVGRLVAASTGIAAADDDLHDLDAHVLALVAPGAARVPRGSAPRGAATRRDDGASAGALAAPGGGQRRLGDGRRRRAHRRAPLFMCSSLSTSPPGGSISESTSGERLCVRGHDLVPLRAPKAGQNRHLACNRAGAAPVGSGPASAPAHPDPLLGVPADRRGRPRAPRAQALRGAGGARRGGPRPHARARARPARGGPRGRARAPHARARDAPRPRRVRGVGRGHERAHARGRARADRPLRLRRHPRPRLARRAAPPLRWRAPRDGRT